MAVTGRGMVLDQAILFDEALEKEWRQRGISAGCYSVHFILGNVKHLSKVTHLGWI